MKKKKVHAGKSRQEKCILTVIAVLCALALCVAGYGVWSMTGNWTTSEKSLDEDDPLAIRRLYVGAYEAQIVQAGRGENKEYYIDLTLPQDFDFSRSALDLELSDGASLSAGSNCLIEELSGRPIINLMVEQASLTIENDNSSRDYRFRIGLLK